MSRYFWANMPQIWIPCLGALGVENNFVAWEVVNVLVRRRPLLGHGP